MLGPARSFLAWPRCGARLFGSTRNPGPGLVVFALVRLSLTRGTIAASAIGYASYGVFLATALKRKRTGREVCRLGVRVAEAAGDPVYRGRARFMYAAFFGPTDEPVRSALTTFRDLVSASLRCGDYPYAGAAANMFLYYLPVVGMPLSEVQAEVRAMLQRRAPDRRA